MKPYSISKKYRTIIVSKEDAELIKNLIPHAVDLKNNLAVPHNMTETRILNNIGYEIPSPIYYYYNWQNSQNYTPYVSQVHTAAFLTTHKRSFCLNDMGTGKTLAALWAADFLIRQREMNKILIVSPLSAVNLVWSDTIWKNLRNRTFAVLTGSKKKRLEKLAENHDFYIINPAGIGIIYEELLKRTDISHLIVDEIAEYRNSRTLKNKLVKSLLSKGKTIWGLTGTPTPSEPTDAYGQIKLINPQNVPTTFKQFRAQTMINVSGFRWIEKHDAKQTVFDAMQPAIRYTREECYDLPPATYVDLEVTLSPEQNSLYKRMQSKLVADYNNSKLVAANEGIKMSKLLQIAGGMIYDTEGQAHAIPCNSRLQELKSVIGNAGTKVIVFVPFTAMTHMVNDFLKKHWTTAVINGSVSLTKRNKIFHAFQSTKDPHVLIAHPRCMSHGLTLTEASTIIWYAPYANPEVYTQANGRISRAPQQENQYYVHLQATYLEREVYKRLRNKQTMQGALLDMFQKAA